MLGMKTKKNPALLKIIGYQTRILIIKKEYVSRSISEMGKGQQKTWTFRRDMSVKKNWLVKINC